MCVLACIVGDDNVKTPETKDDLKAADSTEAKAVADVESTKEPATAGLHMVAPHETLASTESMENLVTNKHCAVVTAPTTIARKECTRIDITPVGEPARPSSPSTKSTNPASKPNGNTPAFEGGEGSRKDKSANVIQENVNSDNNQLM